MVIRESFLLEIWCGICWQYKQTIRTKIAFPANSRKFSPSKVFRYTVTRPWQVNIMLLWQDDLLRN